MPTLHASTHRRATRHLMAASLAILVALAGSRPAVALELAKVGRLSDKRARQGRTLSATMCGNRDPEPYNMHRQNTHQRRRPLLEGTNPRVHPDYRAAALAIELVRKAIAEQTAGPKVGDAFRRALSRKPELAAAFGAFLRDGRWPLEPRHVLLLAEGARPSERVAESPLVRICEGLHRLGHEGTLQLIDNAIDLSYTGEVVTRHDSAGKGQGAILVGQARAPGRVRDAFLLTASDGPAHVPTIELVSSGDLELLKVRGLGAAIRAGER